jgi:hypothetical protein
MTEAFDKTKKRTTKVKKKGSYCLRTQKEGGGEKEVWKKRKKKFLQRYPG